MITNYQLAKLMLMAGGIPSRKRIQKTVHLLQCAGCDFGMEFRLHYYGPYCSALAERIDCLTSSGVFVETSQSTEVGTQYNYRLNEDLVPSLHEHEKSPEGVAARLDIERFQDLLQKLVATKPRVLELASTMAAFFQAERDWDTAQSQAAEFKAESTSSPVMREARRLAEEVIGDTHA